MNGGRARFAARHATLWQSERRTEPASTVTSDRRSDLLRSRARWRRTGCCQLRCGSRLGVDHHAPALLVPELEPHRAYPVPEAEGFECGLLPWERSPARTFATRSWAPSAPSNTGLHTTRAHDLSLILAARSRGGGLLTRRLVRSGLATVVLRDRRLHPSSARGVEMTGRSPPYQGCPRRRSSDRRPAVPGSRRVRCVRASRESGLARVLTVSERAPGDHPLCGPRPASRSSRSRWWRSTCTREVAVWRKAVRSALNACRAFWASSLACRCVATRASHSALA